MTVRYYPEHDTVRITFAATPYRQAGAEPAGEDEAIMLLYDEAGRLAEIEIEGASQRVDLAELRRKVSFEEVRLSAGTAA